MKFFISIFLLTISFASAATTVDCRVFFVGTNNLGATDWDPTPFTFVANSTATQSMTDAISGFELRVRSFKNAGVVEHLFVTLSKPGTSSGCSTHVAGKSIEYMECVGPAGSTGTGSVWVYCSKY